MEKKIIEFIKKLRNKYFYNVYWKQHYKNSWDYGINIIDNVINNYSFNTILDAGCGQGDVIKYLLKNGYDCKGVEISDFIVKQKSLELFNRGIIKISSLENIPFDDNSFDIVFSSDVLEHIPEEKIDIVISELCRVAKYDLFLTINLRPSSENNKYHITLKSREWWEDKFEKNNVQINHLLITKLQKRVKNLNIKEIMELGPTKNILGEIQWFIDNPPYDLKGELEPWYFIFKKNLNE